MRKLLVSLAVTVAAVTMSGCAAGPHQLQRSVDDWDHKMYVNNPWLSAVLVPVVWVCHAGAFVGDFLVGDAYHFWFHDAWDMKGTGFKHADVAPTDGQVGSMLGDGTFLKVMK